MIITICGTPGSGKSSIAKILAEKLGWPRYYGGGILRQQAQEKGMTLMEYIKLGETDPSVDHDVDEFIKKKGETEDNFIVEGRTAWLIIPHSLKIYLTIDEKRAAFLIFRDLQKGVKRNEANDINSEEDMLANIRSRMETDKLRYRKYYNTDVNDPGHYDFVLDTTKLTIPEAADKIYEFIKGKLPK